MERSNRDDAARSVLERSNLDGRLAAGPISWGVCEVPGWGLTLPSDRVLGEMAALGIGGTELGAPGFLPKDADLLGATLERHGLQLVGAFVPVVLHDPSARASTLAAAAEAATLLAAVGHGVLVSTAVLDLAWSAPRPLDDAEHHHLVGMLEALDEVAAEHGLRHALHPHAGTVVETREDVRSVLDASTVHWCLDTGHLLIGGYDPAEFAGDASGRVAHVHLKDVDAGVAARYRRRELGMVEAVREGLFRPLGRGDAPIVATVERLERDGYDGWYVLEQDTDLGPAEPVGAGPINDVRASVDFLHDVLAGAKRA